MIIFLSILFLILAFLETSVFPIPFLLFVIVLLLVYDVKHGLISCFIAGVILDLFAGRLLGSTSLLFLMSYSLWCRFSQKILTNTILYRFVLLLLLATAYHVLMYRTIFLPFLLRDVAVGLALLFVAHKILPHTKRAGRLDV